MHIKKFTQFIVENENYGSINEGDIVPGVEYTTTGPKATGKNVMWVSVTPGGETEICFDRDGKNDAKLVFPNSKKPLILPQAGPAYAYVYKFIDAEKKEVFPAAIAKMDSFDADKSGVSLMNSSNSIDLLAKFMYESGIIADNESVKRLAQVIATLLFSATYNTQVSDTFKKFANNINRNVLMGGFVIKMSDEFIRDKSSGMKVFGEQFKSEVKSLSPKTADAAKK
jgi:hypothetical protein